jgi:hypothetical protein
MEPTQLQFTPPAMRPGGPSGFATPHGTLNPAPAAANGTTAGNAPPVPVLPVNPVHNGAPQSPLNFQTQPPTAPPGFEYVRVRLPDDRNAPVGYNLHPVPPATQYAPSGPSVAFTHPVRNLGPASMHSTIVPGGPGPAPHGFQPQIFHAPVGSPNPSGQYPPVHTAPQFQSAPPGPSFSFPAPVHDQDFRPAPVGSAILSGGPGPAPHGASHPMFYAPVGSSKPSG